MRSNHHKYKMLTETSMLTVLYSHNLMQNSANLVHMYCIYLYILKYGIYTKEHNYEDMCTKYCWICHFSRYTKKLLQWHCLYTHSKQEVRCVLSTKLDCTLLYCHYFTEKCQHCRSPVISFTLTFDLSLRQFGTH